MQNQQVLLDTTSWRKSSVEDQMPTGLRRAGNYLPTHIPCPQNLVEISLEGGKDKVWPWYLALLLCEDNGKRRNRSGQAGELMVMGKHSADFMMTAIGNIKKSRNKLLQENKIILMKSADCLRLKPIESWLTLLPHLCFVSVPPTPQIPTFSLPQLLQNSIFKRFFYTFLVLFLLSWGFHWGIRGI